MFVFIFIFRAQLDSLDSPNFILSGVLIYAASKILGRKVDYFEQEIVGLAENFNKVTEDCKQKEKEAKKTRTKKYVIKDSVNIDKATFDEKPINVTTNNDINKTLTSPSKITRLQQIKEFYAKNNSKSGKLAIPKSLLMNDNACQSNFGSQMIVDYEDDKEIVGQQTRFCIVF
jgi:hypothetical protein